jgi:2'-5' RNA ligase
MVYAIELFFDTATEAKVREAWQTLDAAQIVSPAAIGYPRPHITLAVYAQIDEAVCTERLAAFALATAPFALTLANLGLFPPSQHETVVFAAPTVTVTLLANHEHILHILAQATSGALPYYLPDAWIPHRTLTQHCPPDRVGETIAICRGLPLPLGCQITGIGIVETGAGSLLSSHTLRKNDAAE